MQRNARYSQWPRRAQQAGMALVLGLVILLILTILGVSALRTSSLEQLMAGGVQESTRALQGADSGLTAALYTIQTSSASTDPTVFASTSSATPKYVAYTYTGTSVKAYQPTRIQICNTQKREEKANGYGTTATAFYDERASASTPANANNALRHGLTAPSAANTFSDATCYQ